MFVESLPVREVLTNVAEYLTANLDDREDWQEEIVKAVLANVDQR